MPVLGLNTARNLCIRLAGVKESTEIMLEVSFMTVGKGIWHKVSHRLLEKVDRRVDIAVFTFSK